MGINLSSEVLNYDKILNYNHLNIFRTTRKTIMRTLFCGVILLFAIHVAIFAKDCDENGFDKDFDSDWFWLGSNLKQIGKV